MCVIFGLRYFLNRAASLYKLIQIHIQIIYIYDREPRDVCVYIVTNIPNNTKNTQRWPRSSLIHRFLIQYAQITLQTLDSRQKVRSHC